MLDALTSQPFRGVNLGGWLVLEKWMTPTVFAGLAAGDETAWCVELGRAAQPRLSAHWRDFITRDDFGWLADRGIDAVRIPVGHWVLGAPYPYHRNYGASTAPFVEGGIDVLDRALDWAAHHGLRAMIDLHAAPGCQNGFDNGGMQGVCEWHTREEYVAHSVDVLERLATRYRGHGALHSIEVLNEPRWDVPTEFLQSFYARAYRAIRAHCPAEQVAVVFHDGFRVPREFADLADPTEFRNVAFDIHRYQCFDPADVALDVVGHVEKARVFWKEEALAMRRELAVPTIVGEWSLGLDPSTTSSMSESELTRALRRYAQAQLDAFENHAGWFFWSYRTETTPAWCFRDCVDRGWLPSRFD